MSKGIIDEIGWVACNRCNSLMEYNISEYNNGDTVEYMSCTNCDLKYMVESSKKGDDILPTWKGVPKDFESDVEERIEIIKQWHQIRVRVCGKFGVPHNNIMKSEKTKNHSDSARTPRHSVCFRDMAM